MIKRKIVLLGLLGLLVLSSCDVEMEYVNNDDSSTETRNENHSNDYIDGEILLSDKEYIVPSEDNNSRSVNFINNTAKLNDFSGSISSSILKDQIDNNSSVSPLSIFMSLAMTSSISDGTTKNEILNTLNMTSDEIKTYVNSLLYYAKEKNNDYLNELISNSIWINSNMDYKIDALTELANYYGADSYSAEFETNNQQANDNIKNYVRKNTKGVINKNFEFGTDTAFAIINSIYYQDCWSIINTGLDYSSDTYTFTNINNETKDINLLIGNYTEGRTVEKETYKAFYTKTYNDYSLTFVVPNDNYTINDIFTSNVISYVNSTDFKKEIADSTYNIESDTYYKTRCLFPSFRAGYNENITDYLEELGISDAFSEEADFSPLSDNNMKLSDVIHTAKIKVDAKGIEGAAVTTISGDSASEPVETIYEDFVINKAFGYIISDNNGIPLFTGKINII